MHIPDHFKNTLNYNEYITWRPLQQLNLYRFALTIGFITAFYNNDWISFLGKQDPQAFSITAYTMLIFSLFFLLIGLKHKPNFKTQVIISNASDILFITLLTYFSGGLSSFLGILLIINVTATGTFLGNRHAYLFAALASIAVLSEQTYSMLQGISDTHEYSFAGLLGLTFFSTSFLASILSKRARDSERLADEREVDIINLEILNEDIIQNMRTGILVVDDLGYIHMSNSSAEALLGNTSIQKNSLLKDILPALDSLFIEWQTQPNTHHKAIRQEHGLPDIQPGFRKLQRTGHTPTNSTGETLIFLEDATQLSHRFQQIKLASLGRLTASIAHEIRNPLSAINHAAQLLDETELNSADKKLANIITTQVKRLDKVIENVLQLSRQEQGNSQSLNLNQWLVNFKKDFIEINNLKENQLEIINLSDNKFISFDASHLTQVITNLCLNSITHNNHPPETVKITLKYNYDKDYEQPYLDISDNGPGISTDIIEKIFDPFFTTSTTGTGLGLYITKEMIESNRGRILYTKSSSNENFFRIFFITPPTH